MGIHILLIILLSPMIGGMAILIVPGKKEKAVKIIALLTALISLMLSFAIFLNYDSKTGGLQFLEHYTWIKGYGIDFTLGVDGLSLPLVLLTSIILTCSVLVSYKLQERVKEFFFFMFILSSGVFGVFMSGDLLLMFMFMEMAVIPKFILINVWGSKNKEYAAMKYTLYLLGGSAIALVGIMAIYIYGGDKVLGLGSYTMDIAKLSSIKYDVNFQRFAFFIVMLGFGVLVPMFPLHRWTPDGHSAAPTAISMILAGVIMKLGGYALIRVGINFFPQGAVFWGPLMALLASINAVYVAYVAMVQKDIKYVIANSSVSHMGYVLLGLASYNAASISGAAAQMFAHGIMAALFFALVGLIYEKTHTRMISELGGLAHQMPRIACAFIICGLASLGLPGMFNFIAEFSVFVGAIQVYPLLSVISIFAVVVTASYVLRIIQQVFFGPKNTRWNHLEDAKAMEMIPVVLLCGVMIVLGIFPGLMMNMLKASIVPIVNKFTTLGIGGIL
ncbi:NAD(P)H-quinone oxidoreductase chain 4 1 [Oxobacter pfennigii]|uniref:NAD(P)H-quinone oxidoreductase chain 4 1 n=1 Tax=Oxobacter pfennigii TaxID=36849 RepID=A0A0P9AL64_9CLOT|nr:NADH-quinone oxidoreductase subunit M [Oxobacter pfennigii]KPU46094.1 NAD(P)H-quinone oxidoreductase chain 4 1 [Oxobacter pfennigii]